MGFNIAIAAIVLSNLRQAQAIRLSYRELPARKFNPLPWDMEEFLRLRKPAEAPPDYRMEGSENVGYMIGKAPGRKP